MKYTIAILLILFKLYTFAQHNIGVKINGGISKITEQLIQAPPTTWKYYFKPSAQVGLFYNYSIKKHLIGTELLFVQIEGQNYNQFINTDNFGNPTNAVTKGNVWQHISYLGIPVYYGYTVKKINFNIGLQTNLLLSSSGKASSQYIFNGDTLTFTTIANKLYLNPFDVGARLGVFYNIYKNLSIEANYYYGLTNIHKKSPYWKWQVQQITIGFRYKLIKQ